MGIMDKAREAAQAQITQVRDGREQQAGAVATQTGPCRGDHYVTEVNKGSINMGRWQSHLNDMFGRGYRLAHVLEQDGNTVQVYEHHWH